MNRCLLLPLVAFAAITIASCSSDETAPAAKPASGGAPAAGKVGATAEAELPKIPILPGYKYYVGGPQLAEDKYKKFRIQKFNGEVQQPPSRGMVFGAKQEGDKLEYKVWGNGRLLGFHRGTMRDGLFWPDYVEGYRQGLLVARETMTHDDEAKRTKIVAEDLDPETGEVIRRKELAMSYFPPALEGDEEEDEDEEEKAKAGAAPAPAPAAPVSPPAPPAAPAR